MSPVPLTFDHLKAQAAAVRQKVEGANRIGIHTAGQWTGESERSDSQVTYRIHQCGSPLSFRQALGQPVVGTDVHLYLTPLEDGDLGDEILMRLEKQRLFAVDQWQIIRSLFDAKSVDPRLMKQGWVAEELLRLPAREIIASAPGGFLDEETVWTVLLERCIGLKGSRPDLATVLAWSISEESVARFLALSERVQNGIIDWIDNSAGAAGRTVFEFTQRTRSTDAAPLGHLLGVLASRPRTEAVASSMARVEERFLAGHPLSPEVIGQWATAATPLIASHTGELSRRFLTRLDEMFTLVKAQGLARYSDLSPTGFAGRLEALGTELCDALGRSAVTEADISGLSGLLRDIANHAVARKHHRRVIRCQMALRLARWMCSSKGKRESPGSFGEAAAAELSEASFLDWARLSLRYPEPVETLGRAYATLVSKVTAIREADAEVFARLLKGWLEAGAPQESVICIESVLDRVVVPAAESAPVLLVLLDGMSAAIYQELLEDLQKRRDWKPMQSTKARTPQPIIAGIPSITEVSRCSLFSGKASKGGQDSEKQAFGNHAGLVELSRGTHPPVLFHKASLQDENSLSAELRREIGSSHRRVVGLVLNAIDDQLLNGDQLDIEWNTGSIRILDALLEVARSSGRLVILLSDHGHVLENGARELPVQSGDSGARWRTPAGAVIAGEMEVAGSRVISGTSRSLILPWSEKLRYGAKRSGYHGGVNPQELVLPYAVLCAADKNPDGWRELTVGAPAWWDVSDEQFMQEESRPPAVVEATLEVETSSELFFDHEWREVGTGQKDTVRPSDSPPWIGALLESPTYQQQRRVCGRSVPSSDNVRSFLLCLHDRGGSTTLTALARHLNYPKLRLPGLLALLQRLLNVDGYPVLVKDDGADKIELNIPMLRRQFGVEEAT